MDDVGLDYAISSVFDVIFSKCNTEKDAMNIKEEILMILDESHDEFKEYKNEKN